MSEGQRELRICQDPEEPIYVGLSWLVEASTLPSAAPEEVMSQITAWWFFWLGGSGFLRLPLLPLLQQHRAVWLLKEEEEERICKDHIANMVSLSKIILENALLCCLGNFSPRD